MKVVFRQKAIDDLNDIWEYTLYKWSEEQADKYYLSIRSACKAIEENPAIGKAYPTINKNLLGIKSGRHIIFYQQVTEFEIHVIRILHESMDLKSRIKE